MSIYKRGLPYGDRHRTALPPRVRAAVGFWGRPAGLPAWRTTSLAFPALVLLLLIGCHFPHKVGKTETGAPKYQRLNIVYDLNARYRDLPLSDGRLQPVAFDGGTGDSAQRWSGARLSISYPHPDGLHAMARATLRLSGGAALSSATNAKEPSTDRGTFMQELHDPADVFAGPAELPAAPMADLHSDEIWVLDFPKSELDLLLADLSHSGFFESQVRQDRGTHLDVQIDSGRTHKSWTPESRLDEFVNRVYGQGRLSGFVAADAQHEPDAVSKGTTVAGLPAQRKSFRLRLAKRP